jgi:RNA polymerase sigma-70 factor, ECF subfamily
METAGVMNHNQSEGPAMADGQADADLAGFRDWLMALARAQVPVDLRGRIDPSDIVQETLFHALRDDKRTHDRTAAQTMAWLRAILRCRLIDRMPGRDRENRNVSLDAMLDQTSAGMSELLSASQSSPGSRVIREENAMISAKLLNQLTEAQAEAIVLKHCQGWSVEQISRHLNKTPDAVGGLLRHGLKRLRELMPREE